MVIWATVVALACSAAQGPQDMGALEAHGLMQRLEEREAEIAWLKARLDLQEEELAQAEELGIVEAVKATGLPAHVQRRVAAAIVREARAHGLDPLLVVAVIQAESSFNAFAVSPVGAMGLMQVMPGTGEYWSQKRGQRLGRKTNLFDPELNIELGTSYLSDLIRRFKGVEPALVAYNAGPSAARRIWADPAARRRFVAGYPKKVLRAHERLRAAHASSVAQRSKANSAHPEG